MPYTSLVSLKIQQWGDLTPSSEGSSETFSPPSDTRRAHTPSQPTHHPCPGDHPTKLSTGAKYQEGKLKYAKNPMPSLEKGKHAVTIPVKNTNISIAGHGVAIIWD